MNAFLNIDYGSNIRQISDQTSRIFTCYYNIQISKVIGIKYILFTDISRWCIVIYHTVKIFRHWM